MGLVRADSQDALEYIKVGTNGLFVVCDDVGGLPNGTLASKTTLDSIIADFTMIAATEPIDQLLLCSYGFSNFLMEPDIIHAITNNLRRMLLGSWKEN